MAVKRETSTILVVRLSRAGQVYLEVVRSPRYFPLWLGQLVSNFDNGENPGLSKPLFLRRLDCPPPLSLASVDDETGDDMPNKNSATIEGGVTAFLQTLSGANKSAPQ